MKKKVVIIIPIIIIIIIASIGIYFLYRFGFFFSAGGRYDDTNLNYMGVIYENQSDIHAFNEGFSTSDSCPWGFVHNGIDYFFNNNSDVIAAAPGQVWSIEMRENEGENKYMIRIWIRYNNTTEIGYNFEPWTTHASDRDLQNIMFQVKEGDWVQKGDVIARFLQCNESAHIHFDIVENGNRYCPVKYFSLDDYNELLTLIHFYHPAWNLCYP
jgi:hypothetical protein